MSSCRRYAGNYKNRRTDTAYTILLQKQTGMGQPLFACPHHIISVRPAALLRFAYVCVQTPAWLRVTVVGLCGLLAPVGVQVTVNVSGFIFVTDIVKSPD